MVRERGEPGMTAGVLLCGPGLGMATIPQLGKTVRVVIVGKISVLCGLCHPCGGVDG